MIIRPKQIIPDGLEGLCDSCVYLGSRSIDGVIRHFAFCPDHRNARGYNSIIKLQIGGHWGGHMPCGPAITNWKSGDNRAYWQTIDAYLEMQDLAIQKGLWHE